MITSPYFIRARLFPTILTAIPLLILITKVISPLYYDSLKNIYAELPFIANSGLSAAVIFLCTQINRFIAKEVFQGLYFQDELKMPTTNHLLWNNSFFPIEIKIKIRRKIEERFGIQLLDAAGEEQDETKGRKLIVTAVSQIRNVLRDNKMLFRHNIEYGFWRNLFGGSLLASLISLFILVYALVTKSTVLTNTAVILLIIYMLPILLSKLIIRKYGNYYSKILYEQFLNA